VPGGTLASKNSAKAAAKQAALLLLAPADEYFGPLKESIMGIRNTIRDLGLRYDFNHDIPVQTLASAQLQERAIRDWERKYPRDPQVPRAVFALQRLYTKVLTQDARNRAHVVASWLFADFGRSPQAREMHRVLAVEHLAPLPSAVPAADPAPSGTTQQAGQYQQGFDGSPASQASPMPSP
jgi:hypothetical protein